MLEMGMPVHGVHFHRGERKIAEICLDGIHPRYPFMLALSQATTERLLAGALGAAGGKVERGLKMVECQTFPDHVEATLEKSAGGNREVVQCPWLLAADGAHSVARQKLGIDVPGTSMAHEWHLADVPLRTALAADRAHIFFFDGGRFRFMIRVIDDAQKDRPGEPVWRVMGNRPEPLAQLEQAEQAGPPLWTSSFHISHRIDATQAKDSVYFAGDAAHIHSPAGARGMNLGLEDAWVFSELVQANRLSEYDRLRHSVDQQVVRRVELLSRMIAAESAFFRFVRAFVFPIVVKIPFLRKRIMTVLTGLDRELPQIAVDGAHRS
jgi:2-polyprenyl-6-methoxyphenol hydroxylase-like FAD-dependent oxidoreductase